MNTTTMQVGSYRRKHLHFVGNMVYSSIHVTLNKEKKIMRLRKQLITNLYLKPKDITRLTNGYTIYKRANAHAHAIIPRQLGDVLAEERKALKIAKLEAKLNELKGIDTPVRTKQKYTKRNMEYWNNYKGNNPEIQKKTT